jgi:two-component system NtrC family sensor kinase
LRAVALVNSLLAFSRRTPASDDLSDLTEVLNEIAHETETCLQTYPIRFKFEVADLPVLAVPRGHLTTVLRNLIQNAIEAMPNGGELTLRAAMEDSNAVISVQDTGRGLDEVAKERLFEPFWTTKGVAADSPGTVVGLGLAIAHGLVHVMGGTISVSSRVNEGSTFTVRIPAAQPTP